MGKKRTVSTHEAEPVGQPYHPDEELGPQTWETYLGTDAHGSTSSSQKDLSVPDEAVRNLFVHGIPRPQVHSPEEDAELRRRILAGEQPGSRQSRRRNQR